MNLPRKKKEISLTEELKELELLEEGELVDISDLEIDDLIEENALSVIIRIRGLPIHLLKKQAVESLMGPLGKVEDVQLHAKNSNSVEYVRPLVWINVDEPLQFKRIARFKSGEVIPTELEYEKLIKVCFTCKRLTHDQTHCPLLEEVGFQDQEEIKRKSMLAQMKRTAGASEIEIGNKNEQGKRAVTKNSQVWKAKTSQESEQSKGGSSKSLKISNSHSLQEKSPGGKRTSVGHKRVGSDVSQTPSSVFTRIGSPREKRIPIPFAKPSDRCKGRGGAYDRLEKSWIKQKELYAQGRSSLDDLN
ncbi:hypothetical protein F2Q69_00007638 [Brassica cretica]|uniref:Zinc knuckle CX2CX4HX4C domain-containing protein n=1 Tax=Brassica cretica TaxID=69181 RepID=A0A8S9NZJ1_BRACR|nr:hypothetical protein F2Q69_00007638 [Brassica cretica]